MDIVNRFRFGQSQQVIVATQIVRVISKLDAFCTIR